MFCHKCGKNLDDNGLFCPACGQKVISDTDNNLSNENNSSDSNNSNSKGTKTKNNLIKKIGIGMGVLSVAIVFICIFGSEENNSSTNNSTNNSTMNTNNTTISALISDVVFSDEQIEEFAKDGYNINMFGELIAFKDSSATSANIPDGVVSISDYAFVEGDNLIDITIPKSVKHIGSCAFDWTPWFEAITDEFIIVGDNVLIKYNGSDTNIVIPDGVVSISDFIDYDIIENVTSVVIPNSVSYINKDVFDYTPWFNSLTDEFVIVGNNILLKYNGSKSNVIIPDGVKAIYSNVFKEYSDITSMVIPDSVTYIGNHAFYMCYNLSDLTMSNNITYIDHDVFAYCYAIENIIIPDKVTYIGNGAFFKSSKSTNVIIPNNVTYIGNYAFSGNEILKNITLPDSVRYIGNEAFSYCPNLNDVTVPSSVKYIGKDVFSKSVSLDSIFDGSYLDDEETSVDDTKAVAKELYIQILNEYVKIGHATDMEYEVAGMITAMAYNNIKDCYVAFIDLDNNGIDEMIILSNGVPGVSEDSIIGVYGISENMTEAKLLCQWGNIVIIDNYNIVQTMYTHYNLYEENHYCEIEEIQYAVNGDLLETISISNTESNNLNILNFEYNPISDYI